MSDEKENDIPDELIIVLNKPVAFADLVITELNLHEPTTKEIEDFSKKVTNSKFGALQELNKFVADNAGINPAAFGMIAARHSKKAREFIQNFL